ILPQACQLPDRRCPHRRPGGMIRVKLPCGRGLRSWTLATLGPERRAPRRPRHVTSPAHEGESLMRTDWTRRHLSRLGLAALAWLALAAGAGVADAAGTFRIAVGVDPDTVDPAQNTTTTVGNMVDYVVETLTTLGQDGKIQPLLAESWTLAPDAVTYTFELRKGVIFHDGTPFDAKAVKFTLDRLKDPAVRVPARASLPLKEI